MRSSRSNVHNSSSAATARPPRMMMVLMMAITERVGFIGSPKDDGGRRLDLDGLAGRRERAARLIDIEDHDRIAGLIGRVEMGPRGIEGEEARRSTLRRFPAGAGQQTVRMIDR